MYAFYYKIFEIYIDLHLHKEDFIEIKILTKCSTRCQ